SRRRHTRFSRDWSSDVCSSDLDLLNEHGEPTTFDFSAYLADTATVPDDSVVVYLDAKTAYEIDRLKQEHDEWQRDPGARSITEKIGRAACRGRGSAREGEHRPG